jgi:thiol-disulfide isomerase/thioredoxin
MKKNPAHKNLVKMAEASWFALLFSEARFPKGTFGEEPPLETRLRLYEENVENLKQYCIDNKDDPYLKFAIDMWRLQQLQTAEIIEGSGKIKKGTLMKPALEFCRSLYEKYPDAHEAEGWLRNINNDLVKYEVLTADDPSAAFQVKVEELKQSLKTELNEDSAWQKISGLYGIAQEMDKRKEALIVLLTTIRPVLEASENEKIRDLTLGHAVELNYLALEGVDFELEGITTDGKKINLKDYRGKVVFLDYWSTSCGPCVGDMPNLKRLYETKGGWCESGKVELIGVSVDEDLDALKKFLEKEKITWSNVSIKMSNDQKFPDSAKKYKIDAFPTTILIDQSGKVVRAGGGLYSIIREVGKLLPVEEEKN